MSKLFWLDMEMTGLDPETCVILETAVVVTGIDFVPLETYEAVVRQPPEALAGMDAWNVRTHTATGLLDKVPEGVELADVETELVALASRHFGTERIVLCGNSIGQDRRFVDRYMPLFAEKLHYRVIDVSSFKELVTRLWPDVAFKKRNTHRALEDIQESIAELAFYMTGMRRPEEAAADVSGSGQ